MKGLLIGDVHLNDRPPSIRVDGYAEQIFAKLWLTVLIAGNEKVDFVAYAGDVFHTKSPSRTSHRIVQEMVRVIKAYSCPVLLVAGNHDMTHDRIESLEKQPFGVLVEAGAHMLDGQHPELPVFGIPWLKDWKTELPPYMKRWRESGAELMVTHAPIVKPMQTRPYEYIDADAWAALMDRPGDCYYGHMHMTDGAFMVAGSVFCNQGALSRGSLHEETLKRKPAVTIWDSEQLYQQRFRRVEVPHLPAREVFKLDLKEAEDGRQERLTEFLGAIGQTTFEALTVESVMAHVETLALDADVRQEIQECLHVAL